MSIFLAIGDSILYGLDDENGQGWAGYLKEKLKPHFPEKFRFYNRGISGDTSIDVQQRLGAEIGAIRPEYIIIAVGVNDTQILLPGDQPSVSTLKASRTWHRILSLATMNSKVIVISLLPIDDKYSPEHWEMDKTGVAGIDYLTVRAQAYNEMLKKACDQYDVTYLDLFSLWTAMDYHSMLPDGLHPNEIGHRLISEQVFELLQKHELLPKVAA